MEEVRPFGRISLNSYFNPSLFSSFKGSGRSMKQPLLRFIDIRWKQSFKLKLSLATSSARQTLARCSPFIIFFKVSIAKGNPIRKGDDVYRDRDDSPYVISRTFYLKFAMLSTFKNASIVITVLLLGIAKGEIWSDLRWFAHANAYYSVFEQFPFLLNATPYSHTSAVCYGYRDRSRLLPWFYRDIYKTYHNE